MKKANHFIAYLGTFLFLLFNTMCVQAATLMLNQTVFQPNAAIAATFSGGPGNASDWIGIYPRDVIPNGSPASLLWRYTNGTSTSGGNLTSGAITFSNNGLAPGLYTAWCLANNGYSALSSFNFSISGGAQGWLLNQFTAIHAVAGAAYSANIRAWAKTPGSTTTFTKVSGPNWLNIANNGQISGTPGSGNIGSNVFTIRVTDTNSGQAAGIINCTSTTNCAGTGLALCDQCARQYSNCEPLSDYRKFTNRCSG